MTCRLNQGGVIDRSKPLNFTFNGKPLTGYAGDTLASALLANNIHFVTRSIKLRRPRGIMGRGPEEPNALLQIGEGSSTLADQRATQVMLTEGMNARSINGWPSLEHDLLSLLSLGSKLMPVGFYYKTFMGPKGWWERYEKLIRPIAGMGLTPDGPDPDLYEKRDLHCDVMIVGGGPAGLAAAASLIGTGLRVVLAHEQALWGGGLLASRTQLNGQPANAWLEETLAALHAAENIQLLPSTSVFGHYDHHFLGAIERVREQRPNAPIRERFWKIRCQRLILAAGAIERPIVLSNNDRPGIMTAFAVRESIERYAVLPGKQAVVFTNNDSAYATARCLLDAGAQVTVVDSRASAGAAAKAMLPEQTTVIYNAKVCDTSGKKTD